jgi:hypothetical protein
MAATLVSSSFANNGLTASPDTATVTAPASITAGNLLVAEVTYNSGVTITPPTGFTLYQTILATGGSPVIGIYWKFATGSEPGTYVFTPSSSASVVLVSMVNISGTDQTTPFNGFFVSNSTTAAVTAGSSGGTPSIPTILNCLPIAFFVINQLSPSNTGNPTGLTAGWSSTILNVVQDTSNYTNTSNANGYDATYVATGPLTSSTSVAVVAACTWGGASSVFTGLNVMLFINPLTYGTLAAVPSSVTILGPGTSAAQQVVITETSYTGNFTVAVPTAYQSIVSVATTQTGTYGTSCTIAGPSNSFWVQELAAGTFQINVSGG